MLAIIHRHSKRALAAGLLVAALAPRAEASGARLRWAAVTDPRVTGYRVYVRPVGTPYGAPLDVGRPAAAADGSVSYVVNGLTAGTGYRFGVTAYAANAEESGLAGELALGAVDPCHVDRCATPTWCDIRVAADGSSCDDGLFCNGIAVCIAGSCENGPPPICADAVACTDDACDEALARCAHHPRPGCCATDAECLDSDRCTGGERCIAGTCASTAAMCPASSCADAYCDPTEGCGLMPTPDGITCVANGCGAGAVALEARRLVFRSSDGGARLNLRARFENAAFVDLGGDGFTLEVGNASGDAMYRATVPSDAFVSKGDGAKFRYLSRGDERAATGGIYGVVLKLRGGSWQLNVRASSLGLFDALAQPQVMLAVRLGAACAENPGLACAGNARRLICR